MKKCVTVSGLFLVVLSAASADMVESQVTAAGLFKNGLSVITRNYTLPGAGVHESYTIPEAIHGTLRVSCAEGIRIRTSTRKQSISDSAMTSAQPGRDLVGKRVRLEIDGPERSTVSGTLLASPRGGDTAEGAFYVIALPEGHRTYIDVDTVHRISTEGEVPVFERTESKSVLQFDVPETVVGETTVSLTYLTRRLSWAPSYQIDISNSDQLQIEQTAILRNELEDLKDAQVELISGFPNVEYAHVRSPLHPSASWQRFFQQLSNRMPQDVSSISNVSTQFALSNNGIFIEDDTFGATLPQTGDAIDLHYQDVGEVTLARNEAMHLPLGTATVAYEPVVEWNVSNNPTRAATHNGAPIEDDLWDAVRFVNPFEFPMTTGPAMVIRDGRFMGSKTSQWVSPGDETLVYVNKALSVRVRGEEVEEREANDIVLGRVHYAQRAVDGTLTVRNLRGEPVQMIIRKEFDGELVTASREPKRSVGEAGAGKLNPSTRLTWNVEVPAGEELVLEYCYHYLVR